MASFNPGNIVVYRVGDSSSALSNAATPVFLDEFTPAGNLVQSIPLPTAVNGSNRQLTASGTATSEGFLTRSTDGQYLLLTGYAANPDTAGVASTSTSGASPVLRTVGRVDSSGNIDTTTALNSFSGNNIRSAVSTNGTDIWVTGAPGGSGVRYTTLGSLNSISLGNLNGRQVNIFGGQLYASSAANSVSRVGNGLPTSSSGTNITPLPNVVTNATNTYAFFLADLSSSVAGVDTLYVADDTNGLKKFSYDGTNWNLNSTIDGTYRGLTGSVSGTDVTLYATSGAASGAANSSQLVSLLDTAGYNATFSSTAVTSLEIAATNTAYRGVALAPEAVPEPLTVLGSMFALVWGVGLKRFFAKKA
jgi:hypothetical protein